MIKCKKCNKQGTIYFKHLGNLCNNCFTNTIEKRIRKNIRINKIFKNKDKILVFDDLSNDVLKGIIKDSPKELFLKKIKNIQQINKLQPYIKKNKINKIAISACLDDIVIKFLESFILNKKNKKTKFIDLFENLTSEELEKFSKIKRLNYLKIKKNKSIENFLNKIDHKYPGSKFNLLKMKKKLSEAI